MTEKPFLRNKYFAGKVLTAEDLELEQNYFREKLKLHNRALHGFGVVSGLDVSERGGKLIVKPGLAIDCEGNEILLAALRVEPLPEPNSGMSVYLTIHYRELPTNQIPHLESDELCTFSWVEETCALAFESQNPNQHHRHMRGRWQACGKTHGLVLARLRNAAKGWRLDRRLRRPSVK